MEFYAFVHFGMNTFTNSEWGFGNESPEMFNPTNLDCRQWAKVCKDAGMKGIIITAKHHDGFCLWPSDYTEHSVKNSPWKNGNGDVVRELAEACEEYDLKLGIYLSPWDRNHPDYGKPEYLTYFRNQLRELMTNYGEVFEVWFDGANGGTGYYGGANEERKIDRQTYYDWENTRKIVRELQPMACMFSDAGPDVRWVGNEEGWAMKTNWAPIRRDEFYPGSPNYKELRTGHINGTHWVPAEVDVSIRPGWFYHPSEDHKVKSLPHLLDIYYNSVGRNASLLINFPVDKRGLIHEKDVEQINKLANAVRADFSNDLAFNQKIETTNARGGKKYFGAEKINDDNAESYWAADDSVKSASITIHWDSPKEFNRLLIQEYIKLGQRIKAFNVAVFKNDEWQTIANETTIGHKRILRFSNVIANKLRLTILDSKACPVISNIEVYHAPKVLVEPEISRNKAGMVTMNSFDTGLSVFYTLDNSEPNEGSKKYEGAFSLKRKVTVKAVAINPENGKKSPVKTVKFDISKEKWNVIGMFQSVSGTEKIFDGDSSTSFILNTKLPAALIVDLGEPTQISGFTYLPDQSRWSGGIVNHYNFYVSSDGSNWNKQVSTGEFANIKNSPVLQFKKIEPRTTRFVKFEAISTTTNDSKVGLAEFGILTE